MNRCARLLFLAGFLTGGCGFLGEEEPTPSIVDSEPAAEPVVDAPTREEFEELSNKLDEANQDLSHARWSIDNTLRMVENLNEIVMPICRAKKPEPDSVISLAVPAPTSFQAALPTEKFEEVITAAFGKNAYWYSDRVNALVTAAFNASITPLIPEDETATNMLGDDGVRAWKAALVRVTRTALANPTVLRATYTVAKPALVTWIGTQQKPDRDTLLETIAAYISILVVPVPLDLERAVSYEAAIYDQAEALGSNDPCYEIFREHVLMSARRSEADLLPKEGPLSKVDAIDFNEERRALHFGIRRKKEGGPALVSAWAEILKDFKSTIEAANAAAEKPAETVAEQPIANPPATLADTSTCTGGLLRPDTFPEGGGKWGAVCGGHRYVIGSTVAVDKRNVHTNLELLR